MPLLYTLFVGIPLCLLCVTVGLFLCCTIVFLPFGITFIALGLRALAYPAPTRYHIRIERR
jgi:uncharacterized membrane protein YccF (DUF307 family)